MTQQDSESQIKYSTNTFFKQICASSINRCCKCFTWLLFLLFFFAFISAFISTQIELFYQPVSLNEPPGTLSPFPGIGK